MVAALLHEPHPSRKVIALAWIGVVPSRRGNVPGGGLDSATDLATAFDEHAGDLLGFAMNSLQDRQLAEDCVQETFLRAWRARARFDPTRASVRTWLFSIERNIVIDALRARSRTPRFEAADVLESAPAAGAPDPVDRMRLAQAIALLSHDHRAIVIAIHIAGRSYGEIAAESGVPVATLRTRAFHALRALRRHLDEGSDE